MSATDKFLIFAAVVIGAGAGQHFAGIAGAVVGAFAGLGVLVVVYGVADEINTRLAEHYAGK
jgi:hypothetical protein